MWNMDIEIVAKKFDVQVDKGEKQVHGMPGWTHTVFVIEGFVAIGCGHISNVAIENPVYNGLVWFIGEWRRE